MLRRGVGEGRVIGGDRQLEPRTFEDDDRRDPAPRDGEVEAAGAVRLQAERQDLFEETPAGGIAEPAAPDAPRVQLRQLMNEQPVDERRHGGGIVQPLDLHVTQGGEAPSRSRQVAPQIAGPRQEPAAQVRVSARPRDAHRRRAPEPAWNPVEMRADRVVGMDVEDLEHVDAAVNAGQGQACDLPGPWSRRDQRPGIFLVASPSQVAGDPQHPCASDRQRPYGHEPAVEPHDDDMQPARVRVHVDPCAEGVVPRLGARGVRRDLEQSAPVRPQHAKISSRGYDAHIDPWIDRRL
jgi:hypothetical protein